MQIWFYLIFSLSIFIILLFYLENNFFLGEKNFRKFKSVRKLYQAIKNFQTNKFFRNILNLKSNTNDFFETIISTNTRFADVAGNYEAKEELKEVVKFLQNPELFLRLGIDVPKGVLLEGPPGTGKTLLAKAVAGEAQTAFIKVSGSQFVELVMGVGASRIAKLFQKARKLKPIIIFIDEIDSIAKTRSSANNIGSGNDERDQTLNQLLIELDGFTANLGIVVIGATNQIDLVDPAIKRPGRFDRLISIGNPSLSEREAILRVHARNKKFDNAVFFPEIALRTIGFSGADLENLLNESAILATRLNKSNITKEDIYKTLEKLIFGLEPSKNLSFKYRQQGSFFEIGRALPGFVNELNSERIRIVQRQNESSRISSNSYSLYITRELFIRDIFISISSLMIEKIIAGPSEFSFRAYNDLKKLTRTLRIMSLRYAFTRLEQFKQEVQKKSLYYIGSDVKQDINNKSDLFLTFIIYILLDENKFFLLSYRPLIERLTDELLIKEEIDPLSFKFLCEEYISKYSGSSFLLNRFNNIFLNCYLQNKNELNR